MHSIVILTAMTATSGLFGGHRQQCTSGRCTTAYRAYPAAAAQAPAMIYAPQYNAPRYAAPAPVAQAPTARVSYYQSNYYAPAAASCPTGTCPRR